MTVKEDAQPMAAAEPEIAVVAEPEVAVAGTPAPSTKPVTTTTTTTTVTPAAAPMPPVRMGNLGRNPAKITCPYCNHQGVTRTSEMIDSMTIVAVILLLLFFWPLFWLPLCMPGCKATEHYCSNCNRVVGKAEACT